MGWNVITVWECQLKPSLKKQTLSEIEFHLNHLYLKRLKVSPNINYDNESEVTPISLVAEEGVDYKMKG